MITQSVNVILQKTMMNEEKKAILQKASPWKRTEKLARFDAGAGADHVGRQSIGTTTVFESAVKASIHLQTLDFQRESVYRVC